MSEKNEWSGWTRERERGLRTFFGQSKRERDLDLYVMIRVHTLKHDCCPMMNKCFMRVI